MSLEKFPDLLLNISDADMRPEEIHSYRFRSFTLKPLERQLFEGDRQISLTPKAFDILTLLIDNAGHLVTKEELMETIWTDSFVEEANLARLVHTIRKTLGEDENGNKFIETVPTKGYRFVPEVETVYVTPSAATDGTRAAIVDAVTRAAAAIGLEHGPIHAECRVNAEGVFVLEVAARPIGGLCARALSFTSAGIRDSEIGSGEPAVGSRIPDPDSRIPLEEVLLRHALGENPAWYRREDTASGVMMIPIPRRGIFRGVDGVEAARGVPHIADVQITAKPDQRLLPLPEGASYLGFIFARASRAADVDAALRAAHARLHFAIDPEFRVLDAAHMHYNRHHG